MHNLYEQSIPQPPAPSPLLNRLVASIVIGCAILTVAILIWSLPRGFDVTDESFYLLSFRYPNEYQASFSTFHLLVAKGLGLVDCSVLTYRWLGLLANVFGAVAFAWSFARWQRTVAPASSRPLMVTIGYVMLGSLLVFSIFPRTLSYNSLNSLLLLLGAAAVLLTLRSGPTGCWWLLVAGVAAGLQVFVKPSTAFLVVVSETLLLIWCWQRQGIKAIIGGVLLLGLGIAAGLTFYFVRVQPPLVWYHHLAQEMTVMQTSGGYGIMDLLPSYVKVAGQTLRFMFYPMGPALLLLIGLAWWWPRQLQPATGPRRIAFTLLALAILYTAWQAVRRHWYTNSFSNQYQSLPLLLALLVLAAGVLLVLPATPESTPRLKPTAQLLPVGGWLFMLPFLASMGTINDLRLNLLIDAGPWFALLLLFTGLYLRRLPMGAVSLLLLLPAAWAAEQVGWGTLKTPYGLRQAMSKQVIPLHTAGLTTPLLVDTATATFFTQLTHLLAQSGFRPGDPIVALYDVPGLVYASGGISPGIPWYFSNRNVRNCHALDVTQLPMGKAYIITTRPLEQGIQACLRAKGINFPQQYRLAGALSSPYADKISVYAPL